MYVRDICDVLKNCKVISIVNLQTEDPLRIDMTSAGAWKKLIPFFNEYVCGVVVGDNREVTIEVDYMF